MRKIWFSSKTACSVLRQSSRADAGRAERLLDDEARALRPGLPSPSVCTIDSVPASAASRGRRDACLVALVAQLLDAARPRSRRSRSAGARRTRGQRRLVERRCARTRSTASRGQLRGSLRRPSAAAREADDARRSGAGRATIEVVERRSSLRWARSPVAPTMTMSWPCGRRQASCFFGPGARRTRCAARR